MNKLLEDGFSAREFERCDFLMSEVSARPVALLEDGSAGVRRQRLIVRTGMEEVIGVQKTESWRPSRS